MPVSHDQKPRPDRPRLGTLGHPQSTAIINRGNRSYTEIRQTHTVTDGCTLAVDEEALDRAEQSFGTS